MDERTHERVDDREADDGIDVAMQRASGEATTLDFVQRVFEGIDASAWLVHVATGQVLWANDHARARVAVQPVTDTDRPSVDAHLRLLAAHRSGFRVRERAANIEGFSLALFVAIERRRGNPAWSRGTTHDARASRTWWIEERGFPPSLASVAALLVRGATPEDVARELEITLASARTYIQRVRERLAGDERWWITRRLHVDA